MTRPQVFWGYLIWLPLKNPCPRAGEIFWITSWPKLIPLHNKTIQCLWQKLRKHKCAFWAIRFKHWWVKEAQLYGIEHIGFVHINGNPWYLYNKHNTIFKFSVSFFCLYSPSELMFTDLLLQDLLFLNKDSSWTCADAKKEDNSSEHSEPVLVDTAI